MNIFSWVLKFISGWQTYKQQIAELTRDEMLFVAHQREQELLLLLDVTTQPKDQELNSGIEVRPRTEQQRNDNEQARRLTKAYDVFLTSRSKNKLRILMATMRCHRKLPDVPLYSSVI